MVGNVLEGLADGPPLSELDDMCFLDIEKVPAARQKYKNLRDRRYATRESLDLRRQVFLQDDGAPAAAAYHKPSEVEIVPTWYNLAEGSGHGRGIDVVIGGIYLTSQGHDGNALKPLLDAGQGIHTGYLKAGSLTVDEKLEVISLEEACEGLYATPGPEHPLLHGKPAESRSIVDLIRQYDPAPGEGDAVLELARVLGHVRRNRRGVRVSFIRSLSADRQEAQRETHPAQWCRPPGCVLA